MKIIAGDREFVDDETLDPRDMVTYLAGYKGRSQSSCPNVTDWLTTFGDADDVICITITGALSGSYNTACTAKQIYEAEREGSRVFVLDTLSAGPEIRLILEAVEAQILAGRMYEQICEDISAYTTQTGLLFMLKSLKNFANNGRVSPAVARLVGLAGICIVGKASAEGTLEPMHKVRGESKALETLADGVQAAGWRTGKVRIGHCDNPTAAMKLKAMLAERCPEADILVYELRGLCSFYAERGGLLVGFEKK